MHPVKVDAQLVHTARGRAVAEREMAVSAEELFATLVDGPSWSKWTIAIRDVSWTSPAPFTTGTTRTVVLAGGMTVDEQFWAWDDDRHMGFSVTATNAGWLTAMSELYEVTPLASGRCTMRWTVAPEFTAPLAAAEPVIARAFPMIQRYLMKRLERVVLERKNSD